MFIKKISGSVALSSFRIEMLIRKLKENGINIQNIYTRYEYFVHLHKELNNTEKRTLNGILSLNDNIPFNNQFDLEFLVIPRPSVVSPWSSKATNILHNCGLNVVKRIERGISYYFLMQNQQNISFNDLLNLSVDKYLYDKMSERLVDNNFDLKSIFLEYKPNPIKILDIIKNGIIELENANKELGLSLSKIEIDYLFNTFIKLNRNPTDAEIMMFAQANSEHCRHKIFNSNWIIDGIKQQYSLFELIKNTHNSQPKNTIVAYSDNAAIIKGRNITRFYPSFDLINNNKYQHDVTTMHSIIKVETHNHPTAIAPFYGASTGVGGEIRDEGATGRGSKPKVGLSGFTVSNLCIEDFFHDWEKNSIHPPSNISNALEIIIEGSIGCSSFSNEFGRPNILGYFRVFEQTIQGVHWGYHKPIMIAGGLGEIDAELSHKNLINSDSSVLIQLGGPGFKIGIGGGAASSSNIGDNLEYLDFNSVQRDNPEMQRRAQEVINRCYQNKDLNPIISIHDVGAGGLSNAFPELVNDSKKGAIFDLSKIPIEDYSLSPSDIWCNESQERYVLAVSLDKLDYFKAIANREKCPYAIVGFVTDERKLQLVDKINYPIEKIDIEYFKNKIESNTKKYIDLSMNAIIGDFPKITRNVYKKYIINDEIDLSKIKDNLKIILNKILSHPTVASKSFLITIGDRSVTGLVVRDQMIGPWQIPVSDCAVVLSGYDEFYGNALSIGERTQLSIINPSASVRIAITEAITNILSADINDINDIKLSANWMASCGSPGQDAALYEAVESASIFCQKIGLSIPVGKDSLSMKTSWNDKIVISPVSLIVSAFSIVNDVRKTLTPQLNNNFDTILLLIDLGKNKNRLGGSILSQIYEDFGNEMPDLDNPNDLLMCFHAIKTLKDENLILSYHDRSDGGLLVTLIEMSLCSRIGLTINLDNFIKDATNIDEKFIIKSLFNEEAGIVIQVSKYKLNLVQNILKKFNLFNCSYQVAELNKNKNIEILSKDKIILSEEIKNLGLAWSENSYQISKLRDNPSCAKEEFLLWNNTDDPGLNYIIPFDYKKNIAMPYIKSSISKPKVAILREQGCNSHIETAWAFDSCGFDAIDVHMSDLLDKKISLKNMQGLVAVGGFSYGDVLGAGQGWAKTIRYNQILFDQFSEFFTRKDTFSLGICNGCQMMSSLSDLIPGAESWPKFIRNKSEKYESRLINIEICKSPSLFFSGMEGLRIPIVVAHGEGCADFSSFNHLPKYFACAHYVDHFGNNTDKYPYNPNGSYDGLASLTSADGRATIIMPHPERVTRNVMFSWNPSNTFTNRCNDIDYSPWMRMFQNIRAWIK
ncbi:Phosphoribosylformylglycinamidine synthase [Candidatus Kinetoplastibacterium sorsogonicusi]|uniref:Phosphoribosylformylglycinamidine synthase n=1 Tax=Candidatus Kinetoplastidibacterium kentomonadis TaxID=1576550 RepID=A0A3S7J9S7_9PROT|nr:Phosphoribosylformylglycinamidine synthase [Candidatus Kinetoplastibacterium sorsogonicusi]